MNQPHFKLYLAIIWLIWISAENSFHPFGFLQTVADYLCLFLQTVLLQQY